MSMVAVKGLKQSYGGSHTLWDVDREVPAGSRTCLMGRNGMGKTTLLKCIMGLLPATSGEIAFAGTDLRRLPAHARARLGIGYVPQGRDIFPRLTVEENLRVGLGVRGKGARSIPPRIFDLFPVLKEMRHRRGGGSSRGPAHHPPNGPAPRVRPAPPLPCPPSPGNQPHP